MLLYINLTLQWLLHSWCCRSLGCSMLHHWPWHFPCWDFGILSCHCVSFYANHTERVWNFYGTVTQANPLVPWTTSFVSGETRTADGVNVVGLEIKTGNYACKWFLHSLYKHVLISINLVTKTNGVNKILHPKSILDWQDIAKTPNNADSMLLESLPIIVF